jgi:hypothetical protein
MEATRREKIPRLKWIYIDAYAGPGYHLSRTTGDIIEGSPLIALHTNPPFHEYHFIDTEPAEPDNSEGWPAAEPTSTFTQRIATRYVFGRTRVIVKLKVSSARIIIRYRMPNLQNGSAND